MLLITAIALLILACWYDIKFWRIPNWLNLAGVVAGIAINSYLGNPKTSLYGLLLGFSVGIIFYAACQFGAGDAKLLAALGAIIGARLILFTITASLLIYIAYLLPVRLKKEGLRGLLRHESSSLTTFLITRKIVDFGSNPKKPFAPFVAAGMFTIFILEKINYVF